MRNRTLLLLSMLMASSSPLPAMGQTQGRTATPPPSVTDQVSQAEQQALEQLFETMDMAALGAQYAREFLGQVEYLLGGTGATDRPRAMQIIEQETMAVVEENQFSLMMKLYPVYARHFNEEELAELTAFYQTPTGQKAAMLMPQLMSETLTAGQQWATSLAPVVIQRVMNRMSETRRPPPTAPAEPPPPAGSAP
jgi:hypothetical protein